MPVSERAKQFSPFAALRGLEAALAEKEKVRQPRWELTDDQAAEINRILTERKPGDIVTVLYYNPPEQEYLQLTGAVTKVDSYARFLQIAETRIPLADIFDIIPV